MTYCFDLDRTLCATPSSKKYKEAVPYKNVIEYVNKLYSEDNYIKIFTARGGGSGIDWHETTTSQLKEWGVKYHELIDKGKPHYDIFVDDKAYNSYKWRKENNIAITGFVAGAFDLLHAGHCLFLREAKLSCDYLYVGLQCDPSVESPEKRPLGQSKNSPVQSLEERLLQLESTSYVDKVLVYKTENDLFDLLQELKPNIRILGSDYRGKKATGEEFSEGVVYHERNHQWSSSELRARLSPLITNGS
jgi:glycerol-3-phosphate cytidylyltransferase